MDSSYDSSNTFRFTTQSIERDSTVKADLQQAHGPSALESQDTKYNFKIK